MLCAVFILIILGYRYETLVIQTVDYLQETQWNSELAISSLIPVYAPISGFITHVEVNVFDFIRKGDLLCAYDQINIEYSLARARNEYARALVHEGAATQEERRLAVEIAERELNLSRVLSPVSGIVSIVSVRPNTHVEPGRELMRLIPEEARWIISLSSQQLQTLQKAIHYSVSVPGISRTFTQTSLSLVRKEEDWAIQLPNDMALPTLPIGARVQVTLIESGEPAAWIPISFLTQDHVTGADGSQYPVRILEKDQEMALVQGLTDGVMIQKRRF